MRAPGRLVNQKFGNSKLHVLVPGSGQDRAGAERPEGRSVAVDRPCADRDDRGFRYEAINPVIIEIAHEIVTTKTAFRGAGCYNGLLHCRERHQAELHAARA